VYPYPANIPHSDFIIEEEECKNKNVGENCILRCLPGYNEEPDEPICRDYGDKADWKKSWKM
jgi:hypothetical protein